VLLTLTEKLLIWIFPNQMYFDGMSPLEMRYFNDDKREMPLVISGAFRINRNPNIEALASFTKVHGYLQGNVEQKMARLDKIKGFPIVIIKDNSGKAILSEILLEKAVTDPVAAKLLINMLNDLAK
jgi:beta-galactosidase